MPCVRGTGGRGPRRYTARLNSQRPRDITYRDNGTYDNNERGGTYDNQRNRDNSERTGARSIPSGTEMDVRLQTRLSSKDAMVVDRVEATTMVDLYQGDDLLVPAGSLMEGEGPALAPARNLRVRR